MQQQNESTQSSAVSSEDWLKTIVDQLAGKRPVFHSEADFQHALAWEIQSSYPTAKIRLEINSGRLDQKEQIDIVVQKEDSLFAIELKYKTKQSEMEWGGESFRLTSHNAGPLGRFDFIKDIARMEGFVERHPGATGYAILLTNDAGYWKVPHREDTIDAAFRLPEGGRLEGKRAWSTAASDGTIGKRSPFLELRGVYDLHWAKYSAFPEIISGEFKYLFLRIR